ncbi:ethanolamine ammonia-lyase subunit EutC [Halobacillus sp. BBL2006]|uniref:ethanolamine ammonia-lyase subunit EutC n=1 Tax=Halobacillus sp. BBL2006 TaxID=1543706 RepID=UPI0005442968|nr:ethanolamine ammonia-lyase subunit EutC [Halobacillus sp. BBL2006]KHE71951.1 ethanolamine ammonia-lyase [Halobacillus sp. BBL2006]
MDIEQIVKDVLSEMEDQGNSTSNKPYTQEYKNRHVVYRQEKRVGVDDPKNRDYIEEVQKGTPARIGIGRAGTRMKTKNYLDFRVDHAAAQDAVFKDVADKVLEDMNLPILQSKAASMQEYLMNLDVGRKLNEDSSEWLRENGTKGKQVQIVVSDGLSSTGIEETVPDLLPSLVQGLKAKNISMGDAVFIRKSRVWIQDEVASLVDCDLVISLIGERPGLATSKSISAYIIYKPNKDSVEADRTVFSNIHEGGVPPVEAGAYLADIIEKMLQYKASGVKFSQMQ